RVDIRIIAATNRDLDAAVKEGRFREDLYHRLNVVPVMLPPLRQRTEDIPDLSHWFLQRYSLESKKNFSEVAGEALQRLVAYNWRVIWREFANVIEGAVVLGCEPRIPMTALRGRIVITKRKPPQKILSYRGAMEPPRLDLVWRPLSQPGGTRPAAAKALVL